ncbi:hypothetical protein [Brachyspira hyodysenteriae]|uniref:hypothetical protein n=1 Tax=Brachyspira hyodysenteriae TaxID=159 RepID=UPI0022CD8474|nr:hypothetical protein [Brachyspira hyodysenteriae]MCZ9937875.1 hypothetical protein [Brachyspira hyodysenteriae]MCZ9960431.1 hypothetical protein [Brachyspira hyodysenteriae]
MAESLKKKLKKDKPSNTKKIENNIIDEAVLYNGIKDILEKSNIYLLDLKVRAISDNKKVYAVIFKKKKAYLIHIV